MTGLAHLRNGLPCQDAIAWRPSPRPVLVLSDGAGSAAASELGSRAMAQGMARLLVSLEDLLAGWLDTAEDPIPGLAEAWCMRLLQHAKGLLDDLACVDRRNVRDLRATLLLAVIGTFRTFWFHVGDGMVVIRTAQGLRTLGSAEASKGEFANQTTFVDIAGQADVQWGLVATPDLHGLALMSDGGAEKLVSHDGRRVAARIGHWQDGLLAGKFGAADIALAWHTPEMNERTSLDDRSIVMAARAVAS